MWSPWCITVICVFHKKNATCNTVTSNCKWSFLHALTDPTTLCVFAVGKPQFQFPLQWVQAATNRIRYIVVLLTFCVCVSYKQKHTFAGHLAWNSFLTLFTPRIEKNGWHQRWWLTGDQSVLKNMKSNSINHLLLREHSDLLSVYHSHRMSHSQTQKPWGKC